MLTVGTRFAGRFTVVREVAVGGMGAVYEVRDPNGRRRALKVILPHLAADLKIRERFATEARVGSTIESDHVVEVLDSDTAPATAQPWILMELLTGVTLESRIRREQRLAPAEVARVMKQVGHALAAAHRKGVLHLDLKPANLFLAEPRLVEQASVVKVLDFGIAREIAGGGTSVELTTGGGTESWMAPEQADPGALVRPSVDVWPLGLIAFYLLTGREYWSVQNLPETQRSRVALQREVYFGPLPPASVRASEIGAGGVLPAGFDTWFARCVHRDPAARWPEAGEAVAALLSTLVPGPLSTVPSTVPSRASSNLASTVLPSSPPSAPSWPVATSLAPPPPSPSLPSLPHARGLTEFIPATADALKGQTEFVPSLTPPPTSRTRPAEPPRRTNVVLFAAPVAVLLVGVVGWAVLHGDDRPVASLPRQVANAPSAPSAPSAPNGDPVAATAPAGAVTPVPAVIPAEGAQSLNDVVAASNPWVAIGVGGFQIQQHEVSVGEYRAWRHDTAGGGDTMPVTRVSWDDASGFCRALGGGAGLPGRDIWRAAMGPRTRRGWYVTGVQLAVGAVGANPSDVSPLGVHDLVGNVREWVAEVAPGGHRCMGAAGGDLPDEKPDRVSSGDVGVGPDPEVGFRCARVQSP